MNHRSTAAPAHTKVGLSRSDRAELLRLLRARPRLLRWLLPVAVLLLILLYQLVAAGWIHARLGYPYHIVAEILFFATLGPALAFCFARSFERWLEERDTSDWQAQLLAEVRADAARSRQLNDEALQVLFSTGLVIEALKAANLDLPPKLSRQVEATEKASRVLNRQLRRYLIGANRGVG